MSIKKSAFLIAGTGSGSGKTTITLSLISAFKSLGQSVTAFKCGPDYIDISFHTAVSKRAAINLDRWIMGDDAVKKSFEYWSRETSISIVEGVMGLFDGVDINSNFGSSADIAKLLDIPVILVVNGKGMARSFGAIVKGFSEFDSSLKVAGVIANGVGSKYHASLLKAILKDLKLPDLLGYMGKDKKLKLPERHLGLIPETEKKRDESIFNFMGERAKESIELDRILKLTEKEFSAYKDKFSLSRKNLKFNKRVAVAYDKAFSFYYEDNLKLMRDLGCEIIKFSPLTDSSIPKNCDMLYFGGGFPEVFAKELSENLSMIESIKLFSDNGSNVYAECGGLMYLSQKIITVEKKEYEMCSIFPLVTQMNSNLKRLGYREVKLKSNCFLGKKGDIFRGHEFHYSEVKELANIENVYDSKHPTKKGVNTAGYKINNTIGSYIHIHWASNMNIVNFIIENNKSKS